VAEQRNSAAQELRGRAADVFVQIFAVQHELEWITWHAKNDPSAVDEEMVRSYTANIHAAFPKLLGAMAVFRSLSRGLYDYLVPLTEDLYRLENSVGNALIGLRGKTDTVNAINRVASFAELYHGEGANRPQLMEGSSYRLRR
jgi:hypothetical protein